MSSSRQLARPNTALDLLQLNALSTLALSPKSLVTHNQLQRFNASTALHETSPWTHANKAAQKLSKCIFTGYDTAFDKTPSS